MQSKFLQSVEDKHKKTDVPDYMRLPDSRAGAMSCLVGIAARKSIEEKRPIRIADLVRF